MAPFTLSLMNTHRIDPEATSFTWDISSTEQGIQKALVRHHLEVARAAASDGQHRNMLRKARFVEASVPSLCAFCFLSTVSVYITDLIVPGRAVSVGFRLGTLTLKMQFSLST